MAEEGRPDTRPPPPGGPDDQAPTARRSERRRQPDGPSSGGREPRQPGGRSLRRRLLAPAAVAVVVQGTLVLGDVLPAVDTMAYLESGRNLVGGEGFTRFGQPELHFPPLVPAVLGALLEVTGSEMAAVRTWQLVVGLALAAAVTALAARLWDDDDVTVAAAWVAGTLSGLAPLLVRRGSGSEGITAALLLAALVVVLGRPASAGGGRRPLGALFGGGVLAGLAYLARPEALLPALVLGAALLVDAWRRRSRGLDPSAAIAFGLGLALLVGPYLAYLHSHTGSWSPTSKSQDVSIEAWRAVAEDRRLDRDQMTFALDETGLDLADDTTSLAGLAAEHPGTWLAIVGGNTERLAGLYLLDGRNTLMPLPLVAAAAYAVWRARRRPTALLTLAVGALPLVTCVVFFTLPRYVVLTTAVLAAFAAAGLVEVLRALPRWGRPVLVGVVAVTMAVGVRAEAGGFLPNGTPYETDAPVAVGAWIDENTGPEDRIMTRSYHVQYYARRPVVALPAASFEEVMTFARARGVRYLVADSLMIRSRRPYLAQTLLRDPAPDGLREVAVLGEGRQVTRIFELDPVPPPSDLPPVPLGFVGD